MFIVGNAEACKEQKEQSFQIPETPQSYDPSPAKHFQFSDIATACCKFYS